MKMERIKQIAKERYSMDMTDDMAIKYMEKYADKLGKLSDNELDNVSGGYSYCEHEYHYGKYCETCDVWCDRDVKVDGHGGSGTCFYVCPVCKTKYN